jgi:hypothetical protein
VGCDVGLADSLYHRLTNRGLHVWWDKKCLKEGENWRDGFCDGLAKSRAFVPIISRAAVKPGDEVLNGNFEKLETDGAIDNVLLEWRLAAALLGSGLIEKVINLVVYSTSYSTVVVVVWVVVVCFGGFLLILTFSAILSDFPNFSR